MKKDSIIINDDEDENDNQEISLSPSNSDAEQIPTKEKIQVNAFEDKSLNQLYDDWLELDGQLRLFESKHKEYVSKLDEVESLKAKYRLEFDKYKKKLDQIQKDVTRLKKIHNKKDESTKKNLPNSITRKNSQSTTNLGHMNSPESKEPLGTASRPLPTVNSSPSLDKIVDTLSPIERLNLVSERLETNSLYLSRIADTLPRKNPYLKVILGAVDVSILNKADKWTYKQEYEKFKYIVTGISLFSSLFIWALTSRYRAFDALFHFLLVWYYCTLTIRESILIVNGSNINLWWRLHHFITTVATAILLTWPESKSYHMFRTQFFVFSFYLSFVQVLQFYYQRGCLYRLRALGETHDMDITVEGFHKWTFRGLSFLVPFLIAGYLFQLYNAYTLWKLAYEPTTQEWQVMVLAVIFLVIFLGNILTTWSVLLEKFRGKTPPALLKQKYQSLKTFLSTNYHRRSRSFQQMAQHQSKDD